MTALDPLDPVLASLFERERAEHHPEPMAREEVLMRAERAIRLAALVPAPAPPHPPAPLPSPTSLLAGGPAKIMLAGALAAAFGGGVVVGRASAPTSAPAPVALASSASSASSADPSLGQREAGIPSIEASALPAATLSSPSTASPRPRPADGTSDLAREQELVDTARGALARGRAAEALAATEQHAARFPTGALAEERDALAVQAVALDGQSEQARLRADRFVRRYPRSIFRAAVERAVAKP